MKRKGEKQKNRHSKELRREAVMNLGCNTAVCHIFYHSLAYQGCVLFIMSFLRQKLRRQLSGISVKWRQL